jgi:phosphoribosylformimino-5-aminoimidazole carboxamide ribotide isomerase
MILPVVDLMAGQAVRGIGGRRDEYGPLIPESDPLAVARGFRERFGLWTVYLADLDAIAGSLPNLSLYQSLNADGFSLWVDAGVRKTPDAGPLVRAGVSRVIAGSETLTGPDVLVELVRTLSAKRVVFSLDLKAGRPLVNGEWGTIDPLAIAARAVDAGIASLLILDLTRVGVGDGLGTDALCRECRRLWPKLELIAGGGVRGPSDLADLASIGVNHVLVASALHDGRLSRHDVTSR